MKYIPDLSIIIPARDEEENIVSTIEGVVEVLMKHSVSYEIIVVNDNSTDKTKERASQIASKNIRVIVINNPSRPGFGFAVRAGLDCFRGEYVAILMADQSDSPEDLVRMYQLAREKGYSCVFGSRFTRSFWLPGYSLPKLLLNRLGNACIRLLFSTPYNDMTNAFKLYSKDAIKSVLPLSSKHFDLTIELPIAVMLHGFSYTVIPNTWTNRNHGRSKQNIYNASSRYAMMMISCFITKRMYRNHKNSVNKA